MALSLTDFYLAPPILNIEYLDVTEMLREVGLLSLCVLL